MTTYYDIPEAAWLFRDQIGQRRTEDAKWSPAEESVRQWCLQELIRTYGVRIDCLEIERQVKVARERKPHRADVVVLRDGQPYVVIECKSRRIKTLDDAMKQAQTYARLPDMNATYAVATNGDQWHVSRRIENGWTPVIDLPDFRHGREAADWLQIMTTVSALSPVLFWLGRSVPAKYAPTYFAALQFYFATRNEATIATNRHLLRSADHLLRVLVLFQESEYSHGKLIEACRSLNAFWSDHNADLEIDSDNFPMMAHNANAYLSLYLQDGKHPEIIDMAAMRLISALLDYLSHLKPARCIRYAEITETIQQEVRNYINLSLIIRFNAPLPDPLDNISLSDIRTLCKPAWESLIKRSRSN
jgi:hypothetical protein